MPGDTCFFTIPRLTFPSLSPFLESVEVPRGSGAVHHEGAGKVVGAGAVPVLQVGTGVLLTLFSQLAGVVCCTAIRVCVDAVSHRARLSVTRWEQR